MMHRFEMDENNIRDKDVINENMNNKLSHLLDQCDIWELLEISKGKWREMVVTAAGGLTTNQPTVRPSDCPTDRPTVRPTASQPASQPKSPEWQF